MILKINCLNNNANQRNCFLHTQQQGQNAVNKLNNFDYETLQNDPGYQFRLKQGEESINRAQSARGSLYSGSALKAAQEYGQGLADQTYNDAFNRNLSIANQGLSASGALSGVYDNIGNIKANKTSATSNTLTSTLSGLLNGSGAKQVIGYNPDGTPIYA